MSLRSELTEQKSGGPSGMYRLTMYLNPSTLQIGTWGVRRPQGGVATSA